LRKSDISSQKIYYLLKLWISLQFYFSCDTISYLISFSNSFINGLFNLYLLLLVDDSQIKVKSQKYIPTILLLFLLLAIFKLRNLNDASKLSKTISNPMHKTES